MNWLRAIKQLLGRFWADIFQNGDFLLGVEYLHFLYDKLTGNQYDNWKSGLIAADLSVRQDDLPFVVYISAENVTKEWYQWNKLWENNTSVAFLTHSYSPASDENNMGWLTNSRELIPVPVILVDHLYSYSKMLFSGLDYDFADGQFIFYTDPADLHLPLVKITESDGSLHLYYKMFGFMHRDTKVCDPVTGFESSWLNDCSDVAWDIHQNGATYYNTKRLLGSAVGAVICEDDGVVEEIWTEQGYHCLSVQGKPYISKYPANVVEGQQVEAGTVLFGNLDVWKGTDTPAPEDVPGIQVMTDAGPLTALNDTLEATEVSGMYVLPLTGNPIVSGEYLNICKKNMENDRCPYIQVPISVNPYLFITKTLRRGRAVTVRLITDGLNKLEAAIKCIRKSCCASGIVNIYVEAAVDPVKHVDLETMATTAPTLTESLLGKMYFNTSTKLVYTAMKNAANELVWGNATTPDNNTIYTNKTDSTPYRWVHGYMIDVSDECDFDTATLILSEFAADAGMMAVAVVDTLTIQDECAEAKIQL